MKRRSGDGEVGRRKKEKRERVEESQSHRLMLHTEGCGSEEEDKEVVEEDEENKVEDEEGEVMSSTRRRRWRRTEK